MRLLSILFALLLASPVLWADSESTNFKLESNTQTAGGIFSIVSANYKVEEGSLNWTTGFDLSSANYKLDGNIGVAGIASIPVIQSVTPPDFAKFYTDQSASFIVSASNPNNYPLQYQAKQDGTSKAGPQASSTLAWVLGLADKGRHAVDLNISDAEGTVTKGQSMYVYRRPVK